MTSFLALGGEGRFSSVEIADAELRFHSFRELETEGGSSIDFIAEATDTRGVTVETDFERYVENFLNHNIGKWERFVKFLNNIGFPAPQSIYFGRDIYKISVAPVRLERGRNARVTLALKPEERQRRQRLSQSGRMLPIDEIRGQLDDIAKWLNFERVVRDVTKVVTRS